MLYSPVQGDQPEPDRRWVQLLPQQVQAADVELVADLATTTMKLGELMTMKAGTCSPIDLPSTIEAKVDGVPVIECGYGELNGQYALRVERVLRPERRHEARRRPWLRTRTPPATATADEWARGAGRAGRDANAVPTCQTAPVFAQARAGQRGERRRPRDIDLILDIPVQLTVELGRTKIPIKNILQLAQGSVVELDGLAGEPMDVLVNGCLIAQGEVVVVNDKFGIRLTDIITPSERIRKLKR